MKRILTLVLALVMVISIVPMSVSAATSDAKIYGVSSMLEGFDFSSAGVDFARGEENGTAFAEGTVKPGTYTNNTLQVTFTATMFNLYDYSYVKLAYRTDSKSAKIDVSSRSTAGESWMNSHPACNGDMKWHEIVINAKDIVGGAGVIPAETGVTLVLKPFDSQTVVLDKEYSFDMQYIAFFKTESEANSYKFDPKDDSFEANYGDVEFFYEEADKELIDGYMQKMDNMIVDIENSVSDVEIKGTKYYVSASGDDNNDGLTPDTAWKSIDRVNRQTFNSGDGVLFERGDEWRTTAPLYARSGVTYSAYGSGAKPKIIASADGSGAGKWVPTKYENIYAFAEKIPDERDVGTLVFDGGRAWGIQIQKTNENKWHPIGRVFNGIAWSDTPTGFFEGYMSLCSDLQFYHDWSSDTLYLYSTEGNPGERFSSIEIVDKGHGISLTNDAEVGSAHDIVIDNIEIFGAGSHGIGGGTVKNVTIQYCVLKWIGGSIQGKYIFGTNYGVRYGNAVESYGSSENFVIHDCYASQIYDCCWTVQQQDAATFDGIRMYNNVSEYCNTGLEVWQSGGTVKNMDLHDNYTRFNGYGWSHQRITKDGNFFYGASSTNNTYENNNVHNNVNIFSSCNALLVKATGPDQYNFHDNVYIMENTKYLGGIAKNPGLGTGAMSSSNTKYTESEIKRCVSTGFEVGGKFYYTEESAYAEDMYDTYSPEVGVDVFDDIADNFWGRDAVDYVSLRGYFNGVEPTKFAPDSTMTRGMLVTVLSRIAGESANANSATYTDINKNAWYAPGVAWAEKNGIVKAGGKFRPDELATREEMADMLYRFALSLYKKMDLSSAKSFTDSASVNADYADGIKFCTANGIIGGYSDGSIKPGNSATRAEVATMIRRFNDYISMAETDIEKALAEAEYESIKGDALKKMLDNSGVRATVEADGTVKFVPFLESGAPNIRVLDMLNADVSLSAHPYIVIKYRGELDTGAVFANLVTLYDAAGATSETGVSGYATLEAGALVLDMSAKDYISYGDKLIINIRPWGTASVELDKSEYFIIDEIIITDRKIAATVLAGN